MLVADTKQGRWAEMAGGLGLIDVLALTDNIFATGTNRTNILNMKDSNYY